MPYYKISFTLNAKKIGGRVQAVVVYRQYKEYDIDKVWQLIENKSR